MHLFRLIPLFCWLKLKRCTHSFPFHFFGERETFVFRNYILYAALSINGQVFFALGAAMTTSIKAILAVCRSGAFRCVLTQYHSLPSGEQTSQQNHPTALHKDLRQASVSVLNVEVHNKRPNKYGLFTLQRTWQNGLGPWGCNWTNLEMKTPSNAIWTECLAIMHGITFGENQTQHLIPTVKKRSGGMMIWPGDLSVLGSTMNSRWNVRPFVWLLELPVMWPKFGRI